MGWCGVPRWSSSTRSTRRSRSRRVRRISRSAAASRCCRSWSGAGRGQRTLLDHYARPMVGAAIFGFFVGSIGIAWGLMVATQPVWSRGLLTNLLSLFGRTWDDTLFVNFTRVIGVLMVVLGGAIIAVAIWLLLGAH